MRLLGLAFFVLAMLGQIGDGAFASGLPGPTASPGLQTGALGVICHTGSTPDDHKRRDGAMCPLCCCLAAPVAILLPQPMALPMPRAVAVVEPTRLPPSRAPPSFTLDSAYPRGPPALI